MESRIRQEEAEITRKEKAAFGQAKTEPEVIPAATSLFVVGGGTVSQPMGVSGGGGRRWPRRD